MSEKQAADLVRRFIEAMNARDGAAVAALLTDDVAHDRPDGSREIGADAYRAWLARRIAPSDEVLADVAILTGEGGGRAAAEFTRRGRNADGAAYSKPGGIFFDIDGGRISRISDYSGGK